MVQFKSWLNSYKSSSRYAFAILCANPPKAEKCAAAGGDLLIYGFANKQLNALLDLYRGLVKKVRSQFEILLRIAELRFQQVCTSKETEGTHYATACQSKQSTDHP